MTTNAETAQILIVEDDATLNRMLADQLRRLGYGAWSAYSRQDVERFLTDWEPLLIILDMRLPDADGFELLSSLHEHCPVIVLTAYGSIDDAVMAMKLGASEYLTKPITEKQLELSVNRALETALLRRDHDFFRERSRFKAESQMVGDSPALQELQQLISSVASTDATVLVLGESGAGKQLVAQSIHQQCQRAEHNFVEVDCCTIQESLFESELFGHERGAFTGADRKKQGLVEVADGGTIFLDEIGEISMQMQAKLLRLIETGKFRRVGGTKNITANLRFVAATNRDLGAMCEERTFRSDLYFRLSNFVVQVPPLRDRIEDIDSLAEYFLNTRHFQRNIEKQFTSQAINALRAYSWPGNIRELRNVIERSVLVSGAAPFVRPEHLALPAEKSQSNEACTMSFDHEPTLDEIRKVYLKKLIGTYKGHRARIADVLGISERSTYRLIRRYRLEGDQASE
ncbi:MAG: sigma-54-dependent Fis family transcriptional regulator [Hyphomicrobiales bacterium]|nr:sigma-54-dependent Fis family transcriptional regulator [Hyphomicrobiales bacterium]